MSFITCTGRRCINYGKIGPHTSENLLLCSHYCCGSHLNPSTFLELVVTHTKLGLGSANAQLAVLNVRETVADLDLADLGHVHLIRAVREAEGAVTSPHLGKGGVLGDTLRTVDLNSTVDDTGN